MPETSRRIPSSLERHSRWERFGREGEIPVLLVHPHIAAQTTAPVVVWMHGRTADKEIDPGRYLRWMRAGIGACAIDLPGHGERFDESMQQPNRALDVLVQMLGEIDTIVDQLRNEHASEFNVERLGIGGMSLGGMTALARLTREHSFSCATVEATTGSWRHQIGREMFSLCRDCDVHELDPIQHLDGWREIPLQAFHTIADEWVSVDGQREFLDAVASRYDDPDLIEFVTFDRTGAPFEHAGFGRKSAEAKDRQTRFLSRWLLNGGKPQGDPS